MEEKNSQKHGHVLLTIILAALVGGAFGFFSGFFAGSERINDALYDSLPIEVRLALDGEADVENEEVVTPEVPKTFEEQVIATVKNASPAVVSIIAAKDVPVLERYDFNPFEGGDFFNQFFGGGIFDFGVPQYRENGTERQDVGAGTGFFVSADGYIVTNRHVVADEGADFTVVLQDDTRHEAEVLARDSINDIAILKIEVEEDVPYIEFGESDDIEVGQTVIAIGYALGRFGNSVSRGIISGLSRSITASDGTGQSEDLYDVIQTDTAINPGNSGGPLLNLEGKAIGMNVAIVQGSENIGFALPIEDVRIVVESVKTTGRIVRPYLGVRYVMVTEDLVEANQLQTEHGALVVRGEKNTDLAVLPGSPADIAGIMENDIILEVDGKELDIDYPLALAIRKFNVDDEVVVKVLSKGEEKEVTITLAERR
ncbi:S1C family serine protease [Patescibacteria group bacterium]